MSWYVIAFFIACGSGELLALWKLFNAPNGKAWPWAIAVTLVVATAISGGTWLVIHE